MLREQATPTDKKLSGGPSQPGLYARAQRLVSGLCAPFLDQRNLLAAVPIIGAAILLFCGGSWQFFHQHTDATHYQCYAMAFWQGGQGLKLLPSVQCSFLLPSGVSLSEVLPYHILPFEYPPLTLALFSLALLSPVVYYQIAFAILMALIAMLIYWLLLRYGPRGSALACAFYLVIGAWATAEGRFDLLPAGLTLLCLILVEKRRWTAAYVALALAFLLKIYPLLLLPALFLAEQRDAGRLYQPGQDLTFKTALPAMWRALRDFRGFRWRNTLLFFALLFVVSGLFALLNFQGAIVSQLGYFASRPVQIESTGSTFLWLATLSGHPARLVYSFGSYNILSNLGNVVAFTLDGCFLLGYALALIWQWRGKLDVVQNFILLLLVFVVTNKVFSPQYLIWLIPLLAYSGAFNRLWLLLWSSLCLLTTLNYPFRYPEQIFPSGAIVLPQFFIEIVTARNILFVLIALAFLFNWWNLSQRKPLPEEPLKASS